MFDFMTRSGFLLNIQDKEKAFFLYINKCEQRKAIFKTITQIIKNIYLKTVIIAFSSPHILLS